MNMPKKADVVIVGAGLSGLSAAKRLEEHGIRVLILEARERVGGRTYTRQIKDLGWLDVGASYVGPTQKHILQLASEMGVKTYKVKSDGDCVFYFKGCSLRYPEGWPHRNPIVWLDCNNMMRELDNMSKQVPIELPWTATKADIWDHMTVQQWLESVCWTRAAKEWGRQFVQSIVTVDPWEVSLLWLLWYVNSAGGVDSIWELEGAAQDSKFVGGSQQISEKLAQHLKAEVKLQCPVTGIIQSEDGVTVECKNGSTYKSDYVIVAVPPWLQAGIHYKPPLRTTKRQLLQRMPMGSCIKSQTYYKQAFWKDKGYSGVTATVSEGMLIGDSIDDTREDSKYPALTGFVMAGTAQVASGMSKEERRDQTLISYQKYFGSDEALHPVHYEDFDWMEEPYTGGCFTSVGFPGVLTKYRDEIRLPHGRVMFAGSETATHWCGYMDGAVSAGFRAAGEILHRLGIIDEAEIKPKQDITERKSSSWFVSCAPSVRGLINSSWILMTVATGAALWWKTRQHPVAFHFLQKYLLRSLNLSRR